MLASVGQFWADFSSRLHQNVDFLPATLSSQLSSDGGQISGGTVIFATLEGSMHDNHMGCRTFFETLYLKQTI